MGIQIKKEIPELSTFPLFIAGDQPSHTIHAYNSVFQKQIQAGYGTTSSTLFYLMVDLP
ncbi:MAG: hypothetical protein U5K72_01655 [Balneolaceae bacterium]|nr:hypothetical protein [Balneolaceae bacterium]